MRKIAVFAALAMVVSMFASAPTSYAANANVTIAFAGTGAGTVTSDVGGINCNGVGPVCSSTSVGNGTNITLTATPASGSTFVGWSDSSGTSSTDCTGTLTTCTFKNNTHNITATFSLSSHTLSVTKTGSGTVTSSPAGINCGATCSASYSHGTAVTLTASPSSGYAFTGWSGACTGSGSCALSMDANKSVSATFTQLTYTLGVTVNGGGSVTSDVGGINCPATFCSANLNSGTTVTLTAAATAGFTFGGWTGDCSGTGTCVVTMSAAKNVTATFNLDIIIVTHRTLTVTKSGAGTGLVISSDAAINCGATCSQDGYNGSDDITLTATADSGSVFTGWSGDCTGLTCSVQMSQDRTVNANFELSGEPLSPTPITKDATSVTTSDAVLNATNGQLDATGHSFWVSQSPIDTSSPSIPSGVYSSPDLGAISANADFSYNLSDITTNGVPGNLPAITPNTHYYFVAWSLVGVT